MKSKDYLNIFLQMIFLKTSTLLRILTVFFSLAECSLSSKRLQSFSGLKQMLLFFFLSLAAISDK